MANEPRLQYIDRPEVSETFVDSLYSVIFDGQTFRLEFTTTRMDDPKASQQAQTGRRYTACRLVLPPNAALELTDKMNRMLQAMKQKGIIKENQPPARPLGPVT